MESENDIGTPEVATVVEFKQEPCLLDSPTEMERETENVNIPEVHVKCELATDFATESDKHDSNNDANDKIEVKKEPLSFELEVGCNSDAHEMSSLTANAADFVDVKINVKEEPICLETLSTEPNFELEQIKGNTTEGGYEEFILPESTRLHNPVMWSPEYGMFQTALNQSSSPGQENSAALGDNFTYIFHLDDKMSHRCKFCGRCFSTVASLKHHILLHESKRPFNCNSCDKSFINASHLKKHHLLHEGIRLFECDKCHKAFTTKSNLKVHSFTHDPNRQHYHCNICEKSYVAAETFKAHLLAHEDKILFKCEKCEKGCITASSLKRHQIIHHDNRQQHKCNICGEDFSQETRLRDHSFTHGVGKPYKCKHCDKAYIHKMRLKVHLLTHKDKTTFKCNRCVKCYTTLSGLKTHSLIHKRSCRHSKAKCRMCKRSSGIKCTLKHTI